MKDKAKVLIVGAGQLGARHLQGVLRSQNVSIVDVIDPSENSLVLARQRASEIGNKCKITYENSLNHLKPYYDIAVIATSSKHRFDVLDDLLKKSKVQFIILEKVLFQKIEEYELTENLLRVNNSKAWVNCPRRYFQFYQEIAKFIKGHSNIKCKVTGGNWGICCNSIHFLDIFLMITECELLEVDLSKMSKIAFPAKRSGYLESYGEMNYKFSNNNLLQLICDDSKDNINISIESESIRVELVEAREQGFVYRKENSWKEERIDFRTIYQSELSCTIVDDLLLTNSTKISTFKQAKSLHIPFVESLIKYFNEINKTSEMICPIT